jgi:hypothetical protein
MLQDFLKADPAHRCIGSGAMALCRLVGTERTTPAPTQFHVRVAHAH